MFAVTARARLWTTMGWVTAARGEVGLERRGSAVLPRLDPVRVELCRGHQGQFLRGHVTGNAVALRLQWTGHVGGPGPLTGRHVTGTAPCVVLLAGCLVCIAMGIVA